MHKIFSSMFDKFIEFINMIAVKDFLLSYLIYKYDSC